MHGSRPVVMLAVFTLVLCMGLSGCRKVGRSQVEDTGSESNKGQETDTVVDSQVDMNVSSDTGIDGVNDDSLPPGETTSDTDADLSPSTDTDLATGSEAFDSSDSKNDTDVEVETYETMHEDAGAPDGGASVLTTCQPLDGEDSENDQPVVVSIDSSLVDGTIVDDCEHEAVDYVFTSQEQCLKGAFACPSAMVAFLDECGCGCHISEMYESSYAKEPGIPCRAPLVPSECSGSVGQLAFFETVFLDVTISEESVYLWQQVDSEWDGSSWQDISMVWRVDKQTGGLTPVMDSVKLLLAETADDGIVAPGGKGQYEVGEYTFLIEDRWLVRTSTSDQSSKRMFQIPINDFRFIVIEEEFYATSDDGALWYAQLGEAPTEPIIVEQRGTYDDDDYAPLIGADDKAVYWQAGADPGLRTSDSDPLALFRTCRIK